VAIFLLLHGDYTISSLLSETRHFSLKISRFFMSPVEIPIKVLVKSTVYRRVMCLFRLQKETFEGLSQEALSVCIRTLKFASSQIATKTVRIKQGMFF
jgi:predicted DNA-binding transcriptional regulator YafY